MSKQVPKYVVAMVKRRTRLSRELMNACVAVDEYCASIGLDYNHPDFNDACLCSDIRIYCEAAGAANATLKAIEKVLNEDREVINER